MKRNHLILIMCLCIVVTVLGAIYFIFDKEDDEPTEKSAQTVTVTDAVTDAVNDTQTDRTQETDAQVGMLEQTTAKKPDVSDSTTRREEENVSGYEYAYAGFNPSTAVINTEKWNLLLVNRNYILPDDFTVKTSAVRGGGQSLDYRVTPHYNEMVAAAEADGISLIPVSGYRTVERQRANFERKINYYKGLGYSKAEATRLASEIVLMPATSEHNAGLAMDFGTNGNYTLDENFAKTDAFRWLSENAADYGFILRYPADAQHITMVTYEPWHWRYVGVKAAKEIKASGVTLEEYLGMD